MDHLTLIGLLLMAAAVALAFTEKESEADILERIFQDYNPTFRPTRRNGTNFNPTIVAVNFYVRDIEFVDDIKMEYAIQLTFRQVWQDDRLIFQSPDSGRLQDTSTNEPAARKSGIVGRPYVTIKDAKRIWTPDLFFTNERTGHVHDLLTPNEYVRIFPNGEIMYSTRVSVTLTCPMLLKKFPFDKQTCSIRMASYSYTTEDIIFKWKSDDPVAVGPEIQLSRFVLEKFSTGYCDSHTIFGTYSCIRADFLIKRQFSYYLLQVFIPSTSLVIMAGLSFWLAKTEVVGRLLLALMSYLMMLVAVLFLNSTLPLVSYTKAIDVWTGSCLTFVSFAVWEFILVNFLARGEERNALRLAKTEGQGSAKTGRTLSDKFDVFSRIFYPVAFIAFAGIYIVVYPCSHSNEMVQAQ